MELAGVGGTPFTAFGRVRKVRRPEEVPHHAPGEVFVFKRLDPVSVWAASTTGAAALVSESDGPTSHAVIAAREMGMACVVGVADALNRLTEDETVCVDGPGMVVRRGVQEQQVGPIFPDEETPRSSQVKVKATLSFPKLAPRIAEHTDGIGFLRMEFLLTQIGRHPLGLLDEEGKSRLEQAIADVAREVIRPFTPKPVWIRTIDIPGREYASLEGGERFEVVEENPMLGWRGIRRDLAEERLLRIQIRSVLRLRDLGARNLGLFFPLVQHPDEYREARRIAEEEGFVRGKDGLKLGIMVETPASALLIDEFVDEGLDFVILGNNDLTQLTLGVDRSNPRIAHLFSDQHPAVWRLVERTIQKSKEREVESCVSGQMTSDPDAIRRLRRIGVDSISVYPDSVRKARLVLSSA